MTFKKFYLQYITEKFDNLQEFLLNPEYDEKKFYELISDFEKNGGKIEGSGKFGQVFSHPSWKYVLKTFTDDPCYLKFVRLAYKNPMPGLPKFFDIPRKIVPHFKRDSSQSILYVVKMEKLYPVKMARHEYFALEGKMRSAFFSSQIVAHSLKQNVWGGMSDEDKADIRNRNNASLDEIEGHDDLLHAYLFVMKNLVGDESSCTDDLHMGNLMQRGDGTLVIIDPVWTSDQMTPYEQAAEAGRREMDYYGAEADIYRHQFANTAEMNAREDAQLLRGGKLPKRIKKSKPIPEPTTPPNTATQSSDDKFEFPF